MSFCDEERTGQVWEWQFGSKRVYLVIGRMPGEEGWELVDLYTAKRGAWLPEETFRRAVSDPSPMWRRIA